MNTPNSVRTFRISKSLRAKMDKVAPRDEAGELLPDSFMHFPIEPNRENRKLAKTMVTFLPDCEELQTFWELLKTEGRTTQAIQIRRLWQMRQMSETFLENTRHMKFPRKR